MSVKTVFLTTTGSNNWLVPADFLSFVAVHAIGTGANSQSSGDGGGGGAYAALTSTFPAVTPGVTNVPYTIGATGSIGSGGGTDTTFGTLLKAQSAANAVHANKQPGTAAGSLGDVKFDGGFGGDGSTHASGGGGGGAGGPHGAGARGGNACTNTISFGDYPGAGGGGGGGGSQGIDQGAFVNNPASAVPGTAGGNGFGGSGGGTGGVSIVGSGTNGSAGAAGTGAGGGGGGGFGNASSPPYTVQSGGNGANGSEWLSSLGATAGSGGGGGAGTSGFNAGIANTGGNGGLYGGGGGTKMPSTGTQGLGIQGVVVVIYNSSLGAGDNYLAILGTGG